MVGPMNMFQTRLRFPSGSSDQPLIRSLVRFQATRSRRRPVRCAGYGSHDSRTRRSRGESEAPTASTAGGACPARRKRWARSAGSSWRTRAIAVRTWRETRISRPCSSQVYQVRPTPASSATSSLRSPGVRRRRPLGRPRVVGEIRARRLFRNWLNSDWLVDFIPG